MRNQCLQIIEARAGNIGQVHNEVPSRLSLDKNPSRDASPTKRRSAFLNDLEQSDRHLRHSFTKSIHHSFLSSRF
jgi:hypothetical protein